MNRKVYLVIGILIAALLLLLLLGGCVHRERPGVPPRTPPISTPGVPSTPTPAPPAPKTPVPGRAGDLSGVKVAVLYERVTDGIVIGRTMQDTITIFEETDTDLIFRGFFRWLPVPESADTRIPGYPANYAAEKAAQGYTYQNLGNAIAEIKAAKPEIIFVGALAAQHLNRLEYNDLTHESFTQAQTWEMALDPATLGLTKEIGSKEEFQCMAARGLGIISSTVSCPSGYDPNKVLFYYPDITNEQFQKLLVDYAKKQIDLGADAIWIDMLFDNANLVSKATGNPNHPAIKAPYDAALNIVEQIHEYGLTKHNKYIYVGTQENFLELGYSNPSLSEVSTLDFVTPILKASEVNGDLENSRWDAIKREVDEKLGSDTLILLNLGWGGADDGAGAALTVFTQKLSADQQRAFLSKADSYFTQKGMVFIYPVHGGTFPASSSRLAFGKYNIDDALAPEFNTYNTIKELAQKKAGA